MWTGLTCRLITRSLSSALGRHTLAASFASKPKDQEVASVERIENELFGKYYGDTDSSDIRKGFRSDVRRYRKKPLKTTTTASTQAPTPKKPNPWGIINLPLHDATLG